MTVLGLRIDANHTQTLAVNHADFSTRVTVKEMVVCTVLFASLLVRLCIDL